MAAKGEGPNRGAAMSKSKRKQSDQVKRAAAANCASAIRVDRIDLTDRFEEGCAQAIGIASLLIEADADVAIQNAAAAVRDLIERIRNIGRILLKTSNAPTDDVDLT